MSTIDATEVRWAHRFASLPPCPLRHPELLDRPELRLTLSPADAPLSPWCDYRTSLFLANPSSRPIFGLSIDWGGLAPFIRDRHRLESSFVGQAIGLTGGDCSLPVVIDRAATNDGRTSFRLEFRARCEDGELCSAAVELRLDASSTTRGGCFLEPPFVEFGTVYDLCSHENRERNLPAGEKLVAWSPGRGHSEYPLGGQSSNGEVVFADNDKDHFYRVSNSGRPIWSGTALAQLVLTPAGLFSARPQPRWSRRVRAYVGGSTDLPPLRLSRKPVWVTVSPETLDFDRGSDEYITISLCPERLRRGTYRGEIEFTCPGNPQVMVHLPVSVTLSATGPIAHFSERVVDFGRVCPGRRVSRPLLVANRGVGKLSIEIGDQDTPVERRTIELRNDDDRVDHTARIPLTLDTRRLRTQGVIELELPVKTNSRIVQQRSMTLRVRAHVAELRCEPSDLTSLKIAAGDQVVLPCTVHRSDAQPVRLDSAGVVITRPGPWRLGAEAGGPASVRLVLAAPTKPTQEPLEAALRLVDRTSGLSAEYPIRAVLAPPAAELGLCVSDPLRPVRLGDYLTPRQLRSLVLAIRNISESRLLLREIGYRCRFGRSFRLLEMSFRPLEVGETRRVPVVYARGWTALLGRASRRRVDGTFYVTARYHRGDVAALDVRLSITRKRRDRR